MGGGGARQIHGVWRTATPKNITAVLLFFKRAAPLLSLKLTGTLQVKENPLPFLSGQEPGTAYFLVSANWHKVGETEVNHDICLVPFVWMANPSKRKSSQLPVEDGKS